MAASIHDVMEHLRQADIRLAPHIVLLRDITVVPTETPFVDLAEAIINQQLSEKAGSTIFNRFKASFGGKITPQHILSRSDDELRALGVSWSKARYLKELARAVTEKSVSLEGLAALPDEAVISELTKIKGIGRWTAEMFLMFSLGREDVFSYGDLGLRRAIQRLYGIRKEPTIRQMEKIVRRWQPYRTYGARLLWRTLDLT